MASDKSWKQFLNFINARNKRKHGNYELDDIEDTIFVFLQYLVMTKLKTTCVCDSTSCCRHSKGENK